MSMIPSVKLSKLKSLFKVAENRYLVLLAALVFLSAFADSSFAASEAPNINISVSEGKTGGTVIKYDFGDFQTEEVALEGQTYHALFLKGESNKKKTGLPALPDVSRSIIIPDDAAVEVKILDSSYYELEDFDVVPSKGYISRSVNRLHFPICKSRRYSLYFR